MSYLPLNFMDLYEIDITPQGASRTWKRLAEGISGAVQANNDVVDQTPYLSGNGFGSTDVTGGQKTIAFSGHRVIGDPAQDYIASIANSFGEARKTNFRYLDSQGAGYSGNCTIQAIEVGGGDANAKKDISFQVDINGQPTEIPVSVAGELSITVAGGVLSGTTKATATPDSGNTLAYRLSATDIGQLYANQYIDNYIGYTSGADIKATAGQFLIVFELDANKRLVKVNSHELLAGDITA